MATPHTTESTNPHSVDNDRSEEVGDNETTTSVHHSKEGEKKNQEEKSEEEALLRIPLARVKKIMKQDPDIKLIANNSCFLITKATELFIEYFVNESYERTKRDGRKVIQYRDLAKTVRELEELEFLNDIIPEQTSP